MRELGSLLLSCAATCALVAAAQAEPLTVANVPVRFYLRHGFHGNASTHVLPVVISETRTPCEPWPQYAGYALSWERHRLVITMLLRPQPPVPPSSTPCIDMAIARYVLERVTLRRPLGNRTLLDGSGKPPRPVHTLLAGVPLTVVS